MSIKLVNINKIFKSEKKEYYALKNISMTIEQGEWITVLGPSGSGKTTLLNCISGVDSPTSGYVEIEGTLINQLSQKVLQQFRRTYIGFIFQDYKLFPQYTVLDNICLPFLPYESRKKVVAQAEKILEELQMSTFKKKFPDDLSGGEKQRIAIARAITHQPCWRCLSPGTLKYLRSGGQAPPRS